MINNPLISVIVPCYNQGNYLAEALDSVIAQKYPNWECIIVNDGSNDETERVAKSYLNLDKRFKYLYKENGGLSSARNAGIAAAKGEFILPLDADDLIHKEYIEKAIKAYENKPHLSLVYCQADKFGLQNEYWNLDTYSYSRLLISNCIFCSAVYRKASWKKAGDYNIELKSGYEDWEFWLRMLNEQSEVYQIPEVLFFYRTKEVSMLTSMHEAYLENARNLIYSNASSVYNETHGSYIKLLQENQQLKQLVDKIYKSNSYQTGNVILKPLIFIKNLITGKK